MHNIHAVLLTFNHFVHYILLQVLESDFENDINEFSPAFL